MKPELMRVLIDGHSGPITIEKSNFNVAVHKPFIAPAAETVAKIEVKAEAILEKAEAGAKAVVAEVKKAAGWGNAPPA